MLDKKGETVVYVVTSPENYTIIGVYTTPEKAEEATKELFLKGTRTPLNISEQKVVE